MGDGVGEFSPPQLALLPRCAQAPGFSNQRGWATLDLSSPNGKPVHYMRKINLYPSGSIVLTP
jgi:hypothetical protein